MARPSGGRRNLMLLSAAIVVTIVIAVVMLAAWRRPPTTNLVNDSPDVVTIVTCEPGGPRPTDVPAGSTAMVPVDRCAMILTEGGICTSALTDPKPGPQVYASSLHPYHCGDI